MRTDKCSFLLRFAVGAACTLSTVLVAAQEHSLASGWIRAPALKPGDTIALVAPAGPAEWPPVRAYADALRKAGYQVRVPEDVADRKCGYLAGTDSERAAELNRVVQEFFGSLQVPVVTHYPLGHTRWNTTLPHGGLVELDADELVVRVVENPVEVE